MLHHMIIFFLFIFTGRLGAAADPNYISINCGGAAAATPPGGRHWLRDAAPKGSSTTSTVKGDLITAVDPYKTARISRSQFSYSFQLSPGQKFLRLHFNPSSYNGFESFNDFFSVDAGHLSLLANFSASITARALSLNFLMKELCIIVQENETLNLVFSPETSQWGNSYAFVNGIEIISVISTTPHCHNVDTGIHVLPQKSIIAVDNSTTLERVHYQHIKWGSVSSGDDIAAMFGMWAEPTVKENAEIATNKTWIVSIDVGFKYLVRLHLCEVGLEMDFVLLINNGVCLTSADILQQRGNTNLLWYNNYMVMVEGLKQEGKRDISISLLSHHEFLDRHGPLEGFEVFKLSNYDPSTLIQTEDSPSQTLLRFLRPLLYNPFGRMILSYVVLFHLWTVVLIVYLEQKLSQDDFPKKDSKPSSMGKQVYLSRMGICFSSASVDQNPPPSTTLYSSVAASEATTTSRSEDGSISTAEQMLAQPNLRVFSFAELEAATWNFSSDSVLGEGCFGKVDKGWLDDKAIAKTTITAVKKLNSESLQGFEEWQSEVNFLGRLSYPNLVKLLGYGFEDKELLLVFEYMAKDSLENHLFGRGASMQTLPWDIRLKILIGAARGLASLHASDRKVIYRDFKTANILLDGSYHAKISDFGLAKNGPTASKSHVTTQVMGTYGYAAPEYVPTGNLYVKSDVYGFGVVLVEMLTGLRALDTNRPSGQHSLGDWIKPHLSDRTYGYAAPHYLESEVIMDSSTSLQKLQVPLGFRFNPADEELMGYYLKKKMTSSPLHIDLNTCDPWDLPKRAVSGEQEWYLVRLRDKKYPKRVLVASGYWKAIGIHTPVVPTTKWMMNEYILEDTSHGHGRYNHLSGEYEWFFSLKDGNFPKRPQTYWKARGMINKYILEDTSRDRGRHQSSSLKNKTDVGYLLERESLTWLHRNRPSSAHTLERRSSAVYYGD